MVAGWSATPVVTNSVFWARTRKLAHDRTLAVVHGPRCGHLLHCVVADTVGVPLGLDGGAAGGVGDNEVDVVVVRRQLDGEAEPEEEEGKELLELGPAEGVDVRAGVAGEPAGGVGQGDGGHDRVRMEEAGGDGLRGGATGW